MTRRVALVAYVAAVALIAAMSARASFVSPSLDAVASTFAGRTVTASCEEADEDNSPMQLGAWGYVRKPLGKQTTEHLDADLCRAALAVNDETVDPFYRALGVLVIVHESYHLRRWGLASNEAKVECAAIRHWKVGARLLGASEETVAALWVWALASHYEETNIFSWGTGDRPYRDDSCSIPPLRTEP